MSTASWIALIPSRTCDISRSSGPRTAATMQNSVAPVAAVSSAALTSCGMSSHTERTGEVNWPDWLQKWQSSGQPPVLRLMMPSTSISGPAVLHAYGVGELEQLGDLVVGELQDLDQLVLREADALVEDLDSGAFQDVRHAGKILAAGDRADARSATGTYAGRPGGGRCGSVDCPR